MSVKPWPSVRAVWLLAALVVTAGAQHPDRGLPLADVPSAEIRRDTALPPEPPAAREGRLLAQMLFDQGRLGQALEKIDEVLQTTDQPHAPLLELLTRIQLAQGKTGFARETAARAVAANPSSPAAHYLYAQLLDQSDEAVDVLPAIKHYRAATRLRATAPHDPQITAAWYHLGKLLAQRGYLVAAIEAYGRFDEAVSVSYPEHRTTAPVAPILAEFPSGLVFERLALLRQAGAEAELLPTLEEALGFRPTDVRIVAEYLELLLEQDPAAAWRFAVARIEDPVLGRRLLPLAVRAGTASGELAPWIESRLAQFDGARADRQRLLHTARICDAVGAQDERRLILAALREAEPRDVGIALRYAAALRAAGDHAEMFAELEALAGAEGLTNDLDPAAFEEEWLTPLAETEALRAAATAYAADHPDPTPAQAFALGFVRLAAGESAVGVATLDQAADSVPLARVVLALHALETYAWDAAIEQASALADAYPDVGLLHFIQAQAYDALDQNQQAERTFERALDLAPQNAGYRVAYARHAIKRAEQTALNVNGGALDDIRTRARRYLSAAQRYAQEAIERDPLDPQAFETAINAYLRGGKVEIAQAQLAQARTRGLDSDALRRAATRIKYAESPFSPAHVAALAAQAEAHPDDGRTWLTYGTALLARSRFDEADPVTARALALRPENADAMLLRARVAASNHDYPTATGLLDALTQRFPNRPSLIWTAAAIYGNDFQFERSRELLQRLYALADSETIRQFAIDQLADTHLQVGEPAEALQLLDRYAAEVADNLGLTEKRLIALVRAGRAAEAIQAAEALVDERPQAFERRLILREVLIEAGADDQLRATLEDWHQPGEADRWLELLVRVLIDAEQYEAAAELLGTVDTDQRGARLAVDLLRAEVFSARGLTDLALALLEGEELERGLSQRALRQQIIAVLLEGEQFDEALQRIDAWLPAAAQSEDELYFLLRLKRAVHQSAGDLEAANRTMERMLRMNPTAAGLNNDLGYTWIDMGKNVERALEMVRLAVALEPRNAAYLDSLGWGYYKLGDFERAHKYLTRSARLIDGRDPVVFDHVGDVEYRLGNRAAARAAWQQTLELLAERDAGGMLVDGEKLRDAVQAKLDALDGGTPAVAPTVERSGETTAE